MDRVGGKLLRIGTPVVHLAAALDTLQWREAPQRPGKPVPQGVCCVGNNG